MQHTILKNKNITASELIKEFGSPLYVYDEALLRDRARTIKSILTSQPFKIFYATKANNNINLLKIIKEEGLYFDAMSLGELAILKKAGVENDKIIFSSNNISKEDFKSIIENRVRVCIDSLSQLELYCALENQAEFEIRVNLGKGSGHHEKVITAGAVKFGIQPDLIDQAIERAQYHGCKVTGLSIHIGSLFLDYKVFLDNVAQLLDSASAYPQIKTIDFGGGFGIPYNRAVEQDFPFDSFNQDFTKLIEGWCAQNANRKDIHFSIQPGRYVVAESGVCLTTIHSIKSNYGINFIGTDLGFNQLLRPTLYDSYHEITNLSRQSEQQKTFHITGNICESGDVLGKDRLLPEESEIGDILAVRDTGAYGFSMASSYNGYPRAAEILIKENGQVKLIREREKIESILQGQIID